MFGIFVQLLLSWIIVWFFEKQNLSVLGFRPSKQRLAALLFFFLFTAACCASGFLLKMYFGSQEWGLNPALSARLVLDGLWWNLKSVLFEELIFRGVLLYILLKRIGPGYAVAVSAIAFGIYHWFSFNVIGNPAGMLFAFVTTGLMGLVLAFAYVKTLSLFIPIAIHLGWNFTQIFIFSQGPLGDGIFVPLGNGGFRTGSWLIFISVTFLPMVLAIAGNYFFLQKLVFCRPINPGHALSKA